MKLHTRLRICAAVIAALLTSESTTYVYASNIGMQIEADFTTGGVKDYRKISTITNNGVTALSEPTISSIGVMNFNGNGYLTIEYNNRLKWWYYNGSYNGTVEAWVYSDSWNTWGDANNNQSSLFNTLGWSFGPCNDGKVHFYCETSQGVSYITCPKVLETGKWHHISMSIYMSGGSREIIFRIDGQQVSTMTLPAPLNYDAKLIIGKQNTTCCVGKMFGLSITNGINKYTYSNTYSHYITPVV